MQATKPFVDIRITKNISILNTVFTVLVFTCLSCSKTDSDQSPLDKKIASYFDVLVENRDFSGVILIGNSKEILSTYVSGYSDFTARRDHDLNSQFGVASVSKTVTSAAILKLKDEGRILLDDKVSKYLPEFGYGDKITLLHLLRHESGLQDIDFEIKYFLSSEHLVSNLDNDSLLFEPGTNGKYSNAGFSVLARIVEVVSGLTYEEYLETNLFLPLDMTATGDLSTNKIPENLANPNFPSPAPDLIKPLTNINYSLSLGSGFIYSTATDLWKWGVSIKDKSQVNVFDEVYPYGWGRDSIAGKFSLNQTGLNNGFVSALHVFPDEDLVVVLLCNIQNGMWAEWAKDIAKIFYGDSSKIYYLVKRNIRSVPLVDPDQYVGKYESTSDFFIEIKNNNGDLFLNFNGGDIENYLTPLVDNTFDLRSDAGNITFMSKDSLRLIQETSWGGTSYFVRQD